MRTTLSCISKSGFIMPFRHALFVTRTSALANLETKLRCRMLRFLPSSSIMLKHSIMIPVSRDTALNKETTDLSSLKACLLRVGGLAQRSETLSSDHMSFCLHFSSRPFLSPLTFHQVAFIPGLISPLANLRLYNSASSTRASKDARLLCARTAELL